LDRLLYIDVCIIQAATLATATSTTVRIPIPVEDQDPSFGVYAVPGLKTHVFVGPFTVRYLKKTKKVIGGHTWFFFFSRKIFSIVIKAKVVPKM
jgi:hypothetical protein